MRQEIFNILNTLEENNFEAYIIGGYVRDKLLGIESYDVDIVTNALPKEIINIFNVSLKNSTIYGTTKLINGNYRFDIATYRKEISYNGRNPEVKYIKKLDEDILRRDFTINTIAMNKNGEIIDTLGAIKDLQNKTIKSVGDVNDKLKEDPLRILRALRFSITLDFKLDNNLLNAIKKNMSLIKTLSNTRIKEEFDKILISKNALNGMDFLNKLGILKILNISYRKLIDVDDILGMYAQLKLDDDYPFTKEEKRSINLIKSIVDYGKIDNIILFNNGLYICLVAAKILELDNEDIIMMYNNLPIKSVKDILISSNDIITTLGIEPSNKIKKITELLTRKILQNEIDNNREVMLNYIKELNLDEL